jgi:ribonuclease VapC
MVLDSSVIVAVLIGEPGFDELERKIVDAEAVVIGAPTLFETTMVMSRVGIDSGRALLANFIKNVRVTVVPFDTHHAEVAIEAFREFGKGRHPARLNYGDCMTYATARVAGEPLLFIGNDFARTDIAAA